MQTTINNSIKILGHRGARGEVLENSLAGFIHASKLQPLGLAGIEFDVQINQQGHLVVFHDQTLERFGAGQARINQLTLHEISQVALHEPANLMLPSFSRHPLITLDDFFNAPQLNLHNFSRIELEVKTHARTNYQQLVSALEHALYNLPIADNQLPITLTSFDPTLLASIQRSIKLKHICSGLLIEDKKDLTTVCNRARQLGCSSVGIDYKLIDKAVVKQCQRMNLPITAWTVNSLSDAQRLIDMGVAVIITDYPSMFLQYFKS